jgi:hypothetical protein
MFVRKNKNPSGVVSVQIIDKSRGKYVFRKTIGSSNPAGVPTDSITVPMDSAALVSMAKQWIKDQTGQEILDFTIYEELTRSLLYRISAITISDVKLLLGRIFDQIGFNQIDSDLFKFLDFSRLESPSSKLKTTLSVCSVPRQEPSPCPMLILK